jgi:hypothetical protein
MTSSEIVASIKMRISDPSKRIDLTSVPTPSLFAPVSRTEIEIAQRQMDVAFPAFLFELYSTVGNGGFGPGLGLLGITNGYSGIDNQTLCDKYKNFIGRGWRPNILPLFDWGGGAWSCVDGASVAGTVVTADASGFTATSYTLDSWFAAWVAGVDLTNEIFEYKDVALKNPFTGGVLTTRARARAKGIPLGR